MPKTILPGDKEGENRTSYAVFNVERHNKLVNLTNQVVAYLNKRYGKPQKEYVIPLLSALKKGEDFFELSSKTKTIKLHVKQKKTFKSKYKTVELIC